MNRPVSGAYTVEIKATGTTKFYFPEIPQLRNKKILHIDFHGGLKTPSNLDTVPFGQIYLNLVEAKTNDQVIENLNVIELNHSGNRLLFNKVIDFQRSYFEYKDSVDYITGKSVMCTLWYDEPAVKSFIPEKGQNRILPLQLKLTGKKTYFSENLNFKNAIISALFLSHATTAPDGSEMTLIRNNKFITLSYNNIEFIHQLPISSLSMSLMLFPILLDGIKIDLQKSFIETLATTADDLKTVSFTAIIDDSKQRR